MAPNVERGCFLCESKDHDDCDVDLDELTILGHKLGLSVDAFQAWIEEQKALEREELAEEREALREEAARKERVREAELTLERKRREREERTREVELALAREVAALEERNRQLRLRLQEAQNAAIARESIVANSVDCMDPGTWISDELNEAESSFTSTRRNTSQCDIDFGAPGRQDTVNRGTVVLLGSSTEGTILSCPDNGGERREEDPQRVNVDSSSWVPPVAVRCSAAMGDSPKPRSGMTFSDSSLMQRYAAWDDVNMDEGSSSHFPQDPVTSEHSNSNSLSCGDQTSTEVADKESQWDSVESTRDMGAKNDFRCDGTGLMQGLFRCAVTDESPVRSRERGTIPPWKHVQPTCLS